MICFVFKFLKTFKKFCFAKKICWNNPKRFCFVFKFLEFIVTFLLKILEHNKTFWFGFKVFELKRNVPFLKKKIWNTPKRFGFVSILSFDIGTFMHSFRYWVHSHAPSIRSHKGKKVVWPDFQQMRVPEEPVCIHLFRKNPVFTSLHLKSPIRVVPPLGRAGSGSCSRPKDG